MDLCEDCHAHKGWHKLWCPRARRSLRATQDRLARAERGAKKRG